MNEIELKFLVPTGKLNAIKRQTHIKSAIENQLSAHYFDTPERQLAKKGIAIRIRQEIENPQNTGQQPLEQSGKQADKQADIIISLTVNKPKPTLPQAVYALI